MPVGAPQCDCKKTSGIGGCDQSRNSRSEETGCAEKRLGIYTGRRRCGSGSWNPLYLYFETAWKPYHKEGAPDLYPEDLREEIDKLNDIIFREVNNGVYKAGFARKQKAYDRAYNMVFNRLDWLEERLANQRYLFGDRLTESDVRLYVTLVRFDCAYYPVFRLNKKLLRDYPNLWAYARDLYQTPGFGDTTNFAAIKKHYHIDCCPSNEFAIVPNGPDESLWLTPHGREKLSGK